MFKSVSYVLKENFTNLYRIYCIAKYELLADMRDSKFGLFWNFASPAIQVLTYWLIFGLVWGKKGVDGIEYLPWMLVGYGAWWFIQPCLQSGCSAIFNKIDVITKMKFPVSVLPATVCAKEMFNHFCMMIIVFVTLLISGYMPTLYWLQLLYYMVCAFAFAEAVSLILSVITMLWRDMRKLVTSLMRMLMYFSPIIWDCVVPASVPGHQILNFIIKLNPVHYIINGYRECIFYNRFFWEHPYQTVYFWGVTIAIFTLGSVLMYKFKRKFIDMI